MVEQEATSGKRLLSEKITSFQLTTNAVEFLNKYKWISLPDLMREAIDKSIKEIKLKGMLINEGEEIERSDKITGVSLFKDQKEYLEKNNLINTSKFMRIALDNRIEELKKILENTELRNDEDGLNRGVSESE